MDNVPQVSESEATSYATRGGLVNRYLRRYAERTAQLWVQRLKDSSASKRLSLMYLANGAVLQFMIWETVS